MNLISFKEHKSKFNLKAYFFGHFKVGWWFKSIRNRRCNLCAELGHSGSFFTLRTWCENDHKIWTFRRGAGSMRLVCITNWFTTNVFNFFIGHPNPNENVQLWRDYMRTQYRQKSTVVAMAYHIIIWNWIKSNKHSWHFYSQFQVLNEAFSNYINFRSLGQWKGSICTRLINIYILKIFYALHTCIFQINMVKHVHWASDMKEKFCKNFIEIEFNFYSVFKIHKKKNSPYEL